MVPLTCKIETKWLIPDSHIWLHVFFFCWVICEHSHCMNIKEKSASGLNSFCLRFMGCICIARGSKLGICDLIAFYAIVKTTADAHWFQQTSGLISSFMCVCFSLLWPSFISKCGLSPRIWAALPRWDLLVWRFMTSTWTSYEAPASSGQRLRWRTSQSNCIMLRVMTFCPKQSSESHGCPSH